MSKTAIIFAVIIVALIYLVYYNPEMLSKITSSDAPVKTVPTTSSSSAPAAPSYTATPVSPCAAYNNDSKNVSNSCLRKQWADSGCTTGATLIPDTYNGWWNQQTYKTVKDDMNLWATWRSENHRSTCYGPDRSKWPA